MTSKETAAANSADLLKQIEQLERDVASLSQSLARSRRTRQFMLLAAFVVVAGMGTLFYRLGSQLQSPENLQAIMSVAEKRLADRSESYLKEVEKLIENTSPTLTAAFYQQAKQDMPLYLTAIGSERDQLVTNLEQRLSERVDNLQHDNLMEIQSVVTEEFPESKDSEAQVRMLANLELIVQKIARKHYAEPLKAQMLGMYETWDDFPVAEAAVEGDLPLEDQIVGHLLDLLEIKLTESGELSRRPAG